MAGKGNPRTGGRAPGALNKINREFKELVQSILFDEPEVTRQKILDLRDSKDASDRKTFWGLASKMLPQKIEGKLDGFIPTLVLHQDYLRGKTWESEAETDENNEPDSTDEAVRQRARS